MDQRSVEFTTRIYPVAERFARHCLKDDERVSIALVLAWYYWNQANDEAKSLPASVWARVGVRHALAGRDLPGVQSSKKQDAIERPDTWQGSDMGLVMDRRPGPEREVMDAEQAAHFWASLTPRERLIALALLDGKEAREVAEQVGISSPRVSQIRQQLRDRWNG